MQLTSDDNATAATTLSAPPKRLTREEELSLERELAAARATYGYGSPTVILAQH